MRELITQPAWPVLQADLRRDVPEIWLAEVARLLPELSEALEAQTAVRPAEEARLWEGVHQFIAALARHKPLVFFIDDLDWADASTLALLGYLARQAGGGSIRLLATLRLITPRAPMAASSRR